MLRFAVIVVLLANAGYYAWSQGLLRQWGLAPQEQSEPQRMDQQIRPETLQILKVNPGKGAAASSPAAAPSAPPSAPTPAVAEAPPPAPDPTECLQAGVFDERQAEALRTAAAALPRGSWVLDPTPLPGRWMVYMGRFDDLEALDKKRTELRARNVDFDRAGGSWEYGLSLGRFSTKEAAERELTNLNNKGVRTARVIQERPEVGGFTLRLPAVNNALRPQLDALRPALSGKTLRACG
ncbi:SPOR domain-containing protein [Acidovorax radicis]|jgi:hypothetical protein|uniref:SPOR domain-containing protein n=1 Tax=Acidovorax radicis TaxID=758826 RepID=UPI001CF8DFAE|nr:SPOR domain-containing protein [Acidovorax radicis]UCU99067.1 SPOR domain-containing protein [Acidovorax radicis]